MAAVRLSIIIVRMHDTPPKLKSISFEKIKSFAVSVIYRVSHLIILLAFIVYCDKIYLRRIYLSYMYLVSSAKQLQIHDIFQYVS